MYMRKNAWSNDCQFKSHLILYLYIEDFGVIKLIKVSFYIIEFIS